MTKKVFAICVLATLSFATQANAKMVDQDRNALLVDAVGEHQPARTIFDQLRDTAP